MYIPRLASDLDCPDRIRRRARALAEAAEDAGVTTGVHPAGVTQLAVYQAHKRERGLVRESSP